MERKNVNKETIKLYLREMRRYPKSLVMMVLVGPSRAIRSVFVGLVASFLYGDLAAHRPINWTLIIVTFSLFFASILFDYLANLSHSKMQLGSMKRLYERCFEWLTIQDAQFYSDHFGGSLVAKANRFVKAYDLFGLTLQAELLPMLFTVFGSIGVMTYYNWQIGLSVLVAWLISASIIGWRVVKRVPVRRRAVEADSIQTGQLADAVTNAMTIKAFGHEAYESKRYTKATTETQARYRTSWRLGLKNEAFILLFAGIMQAVVVIGGVMMVHAGKMTLAVFLLYQVYVVRIIENLFRSGTLVRNFEGILGDSEEMMEILLSEPKIKDRSHTKKLAVKEGAISFDRVDFMYGDSAGKALLKDFSISIKAHEKVGLVGPSGGGKTSITRLLLRYYDIQSGQISIDGQPIDEVAQIELRQAISYVSQEPILFHRSLMENIRYGRLNATDEEVIEASKLANAHEFIAELPNGYDTLVGERGVKLSGGQRQRVAIARAMLKQAPILVLDEATSALDSESEVLIQEALWRLMKGKTAVVIAHRLSTIQKLDRIVVLDKGKVVEEGTHKNLLKKKDGLYARLWTHQSGGFLQ